MKYTPGDLLYVMKLERLSLDQACKRHPDRHLELVYFKLGPQMAGDMDVPVGTIPAVFVWPDRQTAEAGDASTCIARYWLQESD